MQVKTHAVMETTKATVQGIMVERGDKITGHRSEEAGMGPMLGGPSPTFNFTKELKNICKTYNVDQEERNAYF